MLKVARIFRWALALGVAGLVACSYAQPALALDNVPPPDPSNARSHVGTSFIPFFLAGGSVRADDAALFNITERFGGNFGLGFLFRIRSVAFGLSYEYNGLGREDSGVGPYGFVHVTRSLDTVWASLKVNFSGLTWATPYLGIGAGLVWQDATMKGVVLPDGGVSGGIPFACTSSDSASGALRLGTGTAVHLTPKVSLLVDATFDAYRLSSEVMQFCAPGAGATSTIQLRVGLAYHFDIVESPKPQRRTTAHR